MIFRRLDLLDHTGMKLIHSTPDGLLWAVRLWIHPRLFPGLLSIERYKYLRCSASPTCRSWEDNQSLHSTFISITIMILGATPLELLGVDSTEAGHPSQAASSSPNTENDPQKHSSNIKNEPGAQKPAAEAKGSSNKPGEGAKASKSAS